MAERPYQKTPEVRALLPADGPVTGPLKFVFTEGTHVSITTDGSHNVDDGEHVEFRGKEYLLHVHAYLHGDGTWRTEQPDGEYVTKPSVMRRGVFGVDATPYAANKIVAEVLGVIPSVATPEVLAQAEFARAYNDETSAQGEVNKAVKLLADARKVEQTATARRKRAERRLTDLLTEGN